MPAKITIEEGIMHRKWCRPPNASIDMIGSIHDDPVAQKFGFQSGLVSGTVLFELFPPLILKAFGERWFERGSISLYFPTPITDHEEVRAVIGVPPKSSKDVQVAAWVERPDGHRVGEGTVALGDPDQPSALRARKLDRFATGELRILAGLEAGDEIPRIEVVLTKEEADSRMKTIQEFLDWYQRDWPWGAPPVITRNIVQTMVRPAASYLGARMREAVVVYGALEVRNVNGPLKVDHPYEGGGTILHLGASPQTEYLWYDTYLENKDGTRITEMRMMMRFMKAHSKAYPDL